MDVVKLLEVGLLVWLMLLAAIVAGRILQDDIGTTGLLAARRGAAIDPERVLALALFPSILFYYVIQTLNADLPFTPAGRPIMPDIPENLVTLLTGGNGLYLAGKIARRG